MADYPAIIVDENGDQTAGNTISFTDPDNQPGPPFSAAPTGTSVLWKDSPDGDPIIDFDADGSPQINLEYKTHVQGDLTSSGQVDGGTLGPTFPYVTVQAGAPGADFNTPLIFDTTAVSGGLSAWDGSAYQQVGGPLA